MPRCEYCVVEFTTILLQMANGDWCCPVCFTEWFTACHDCGATCYRDDEYTNSEGNLLCGDCWDRSRHWDSGHFNTTNVTAKRLGSTRAFGIELETSECPKYETLKGKTVFGAKPDGSIDGMEFVSPILAGDQGIAEVRKFCRHAKRLRFKSFSDCGYHIHIDMRNTTEKMRQLIAYAYSLTYKLWAGLVNRDRLSNSFCRPPEYTPADVKNSRYFDDDFCRNRYQFINWAAYRSHKTLEIRGHHGTLDTKEVCNWISAHLRFVDAIRDMTFDELNDMFGGSKARARKHLRRILGQRLSRFYARKFRESRDLVVDNRSNRW